MVFILRDSYLLLKLMVTTFHIVEFFSVSTATL